MNMFILYAKTPEKKRFHPMDYKNGTVVSNRIHATLFSQSESEKIKKDIPALEDINPGWKFEIRPTK